ncbi:MAG: endolytic transglycosylase MltG [Cytophagales bacterium]|nr:endolytic transglycosylase MltG [Cytophagales bacterium]
MLKKIRWQRTHKILLTSVVLSIVLSSFGFYAYQIMHAPNILVGAKSDSSFYVYPRDDFRTIRIRLQEKNYIGDPVSFSFLARILGWDKRILVGHYQLQKNASNLATLKKLHRGWQNPIRLTFNRVRKIEELPNLFSSLLLNPQDLKQKLCSDKTAKQYGFNSENFLLMFIPNTYEFYWDVSTQSFLDRMHNEYQRFWSNKRRKKADSLGLTPIEVGILASIVQAETTKQEEMARVAGVYLNRLARGIFLSADPTLVYAWDDFSIRRVLNRHKNIDSPYNTYRNPGLPPGPINSPEPYTLDAVLSAEKHKYLYFCAKHDFSGFHVFSRSLKEHMKHAKSYQRSLNRARLFR